MGGSAPTTQSVNGASAVPSGLGDQFEPLLREACKGALGPISWFRADWQRGGARTGRAKFTGGASGGLTVDVVVKIPVGPVEYLWNQRLQPDERDSYGVTAKLYSSGTSLGAYDFAWLVMERFPEGPLFTLDRQDGMHLMADVAARFHRMASKYPVEGGGCVDPWEELVGKARDVCHTNNVANEHRWATALKGVAKALPRLVDEWKARRCEDWCHGDLHPANAMSRSNRPEDPAMLIDLAEVRVGNWIEDAIHLERLYWTKRELVARHSPVNLIGQKRRELGLRAEEENQGRLADIRRILLAATTAAFLRTQGSPAFMEASLEVLEVAMGRIAR